jgi:hypothetical protein
MIVAGQLIRPTAQQLSSRDLLRAPDFLPSPPSGLNAFSQSPRGSLPCRAARVGAPLPFDNRNCLGKIPQIPSFVEITNSLAFSKNSTPLESSKSKLFCKNTRVGGTGAHHLFSGQPFSVASVPRSSAPLPHVCRSFVFSSLQNPFSATPLFSNPCKTPGGVGWLLSTFNCRLSTSWSTSRC